MLQKFLRVDFRAFFFDERSRLIHRAHKGLDEFERESRHFGNAFNHKKKVFFEFRQIALHLVQALVIFFAVPVDEFAQIKNRNVDFLCKREIRLIAPLRLPSV